VSRPRLLRLSIEQDRALGQRLVLYAPSLWDWAWPDLPEHIELAQAIAELGEHRLATEYVCRAIQIARNKRRRTNQRRSCQPRIDGRPVAS
jgi:hypothetical protein